MVGVCGTYWGGKGWGQLRVKVKRLVPVLNMFGREMVQVLWTNQSAWWSVISEIQHDFDVYTLNYTYFSLFFFSFLFIFLSWFSSLLIRFEGAPFWQSTGRISLNREKGDNASRSRNIFHIISLTFSFVKRPLRVLNNRCIGFANSNIGRLCGEIPKISPYSGWQDPLIQR